MEKSLEKCLDEVSHAAGVQGVLCVDEHGLCLGVRGKASSKSAGGVAAIAEKAAMLEPSGGQFPVVLLETDSSECLIHQDNGITMAIYKTSDN